MAPNILVAAVVLSTALFLVVALPAPQGDDGAAPPPAPAPAPAGGSQGGQPGSNNYIDCKQWQAQCTNQTGSFNASTIPMSTPAPPMSNDQIPQNQTAMCQNQQAQLMCSTLTTNMNVTQIQNVNQIPTMPTMSPNMFNASGMPMPMPGGK